MARLINYLSFEDSKTALAYYQEVFNAQVNEVYPAGEDMLKKMGIDKKPEDTVMHASFKIFGNVINCSDRFNSRADFTDAITLMIDVNSEDAGELAQLEELYAKVTAHTDTTVVMPLDDQFWGGKMGMVKDKFQIQWMFHAQPYSKLQESGVMK